ncbi:MAG TPA: molybdopterin cofactor-binding domain-containing protein [Sporichthya sp.]|nr:molybdopterin cofactor-binding domain-containing protein [Sporichthya sp.]
MLHAALVRSPHAHAAVLGVDERPALQLPGVVGVLTAADLPGQLCHGPVRADRPVLAAGVVRHVGEPVAAVLAEDAAVAAQAASLVAVTYRELPAVDWFRGDRSDPLHPDGNVLRSVRVRRGSLPDSSDAVVESAYNTHGSSPVPDPFGDDGWPAAPTVVEAVPAADGVRIRAPRRWHPADRDQIARCLDLMPHQISLESGSGEPDHSTDLGGAVVAAVFARRHGRPVRLALGTPPAGHGGGPMVSLRYRHHANSDGTLLGLQAQIEVEAGAYAGLSDALVAQVCSIGAGPYRVPAVDLRVTAHRSTTPPPMVAPGLLAAAVTFAVEAQLDRVARELKIEPRVVRERNVLALDDPLPTGQFPLEESPVPGLLAALDAVPLPPVPAARGQGESWGSGTGVGMLPFGAGEGADVPVQAHVRLLAGTASVTCAAAEGDEHLEAAAVAAAGDALGVPVLFERTGEPLPGGGATSVGLAVSAAVDSLTAPARETLGWRTGMSPSLLRAVRGRFRSYDNVIDVPLAELITGKADGSGWYAPGRSEPLGTDGQGDAYPGYAYAAARALVRMSADARVEIVRLDVAADCGRVLDEARTRAAVEASVRTGIELAMPEATVAPEAVSVRLLDGVIPKGAAGVAAGAVVAALRAAADSAIGNDAEVLPIPGVSWSSVTAPDATAGHVAEGTG